MLPVTALTLSSVSHLFIGQHDLHSTLPVSQHKELVLPKKLQPATQDNILASVTASEIPTEVGAPSVACCTLVGLQIVPIVLFFAMVKQNTHFTINTAVLGVVSYCSIKVRDKRNL